MRLPLIIAPCALALAFAAVPPAAAFAQDVAARASGSVRVYADDDRVTVISPAASATLPIGRAIVVDVDATADIVTAASVDVTSQASPHAFEEHRLEGGVALSWAASRTTAVRAAANLSDEHDYTSLHLGGGGRVELAQRSVVLDLSYTAAIDEVGRAGDPLFSRSRRGHRLVATWTQVLDERGYLDVVLDGELVSGFQASPYRYGPIFDPQGERLFSLSERAPELRRSGAALARIRRALTDRLFAHADYRFYADDWSIVSHTATVRVIWSLQAASLALHARGYTQSAALFHRPRYVVDDDVAPAWRTRDRSLGAMRSLTAGATWEVGLPGELRVVVSAAWTRFIWLDDPLQSMRDAVIALIGVTTPL
jgi:hypothetical protein